MGKEADNKDMDRKKAVRVPAAGVHASKQGNGVKQAAAVKQPNAVKQAAAVRQSGTAKPSGTARQSGAVKQAGTAKHSNVKKAGKNRKKSKNIAKKSASVFSKITFKAAMYIIGAVLVVLISRSAFAFGEKIFSEEGMAEKGKGQEVVITIPADASTGEVASILKKNGLIESELVFKIQTMLYEAEIYSGTYTVNTEYSPEEIIEALRPKKEEK
ncbi:MAG: endolytic transglycosylase MltG [Lachnospiraceae bacterium]